MSDRLSRRDFSRRTALAGLGLGMSRLADSAPGLDAMTTPAAPTPSLADGERLAAAEFPRQRDGVYLNHAASSPLPKRSSDALRGYISDRERLFHLYQTGTQDYALPVLQGKVARLFNVPPDLVAFVPTTTEAMSAALNSIEWRAGDNVVVPANEFPGVLYPSLHLARRGVEVRQVPVDHHADLDRVLSAIDGRTRAVAISWVHWLTGHRLDLARLGAECRTRNVLSIVDAIQGVGAVPIDVSAAQVDFFVAGSYKWLMGIPGTAAVYTSPQFLAAAVPDRAGHASMKTSVYDAPHIEWLPGAARFQVGGPINGALIALEHSVDLLSEVGVARVQAHVSTLLDALRSHGESAGFRFNSDLSNAHRSTFVNVTTGDIARDDRIVKGLVAQGIVVGRRGPGIRIAPHLHNNVDDIARLVDAARRIA
ncbi:MAG: aminotransferase class V-fold PLP-dependent enzyme [Gemmatimonadaceae bacterium]